MAEVKGSGTDGISRRVAQQLRQDVPGSVKTRAAEVASPPEKPINREVTKRLGLKDRFSSKAMKPIRGKASASTLRAELHAHAELPRIGGCFGKASEALRESGMPLAGKAAASLGAQLHSAATDNRPGFSDTVKALSDAAQALVSIFDDAAEGVEATKEGFEALTGLSKGADPLELFNEAVGAFADVGDLVMHGIETLGEGAKELLEVVGGLLGEEPQPVQAQADAQAEASAEVDEAVTFDNRYRAGPSLADVKSGKAELKIGDKGEAVKELQRKLGVKADGYFGPITLRALEQAQSEAGVTGTPGHAGKSTFDAVENGSLKPRVAEGGGSVKPVAEGGAAASPTAPRVAGPEAAGVTAPVAGNQPTSSSLINANDPTLRKLAKANLGSGREHSCVATTRNNMVRAGVIKPFSTGRDIGNNPRGAMVQMGQQGWKSVPFPGSQPTTLKSPYGTMQANVIPRDQYLKLMKEGKIPEGALVFSTRHDDWNGTSKGSRGYDMALVRNGGLYNYKQVGPSMYKDLKSVVVMVPGSALGAGAQTSRPQSVVGAASGQVDGKVGGGGRNNNLSGITSNKGLDSDKYDPIIREMAAKYGVPARLLKAQMKQESQFDPNARSPKGATGLIQLMPDTAREMGVRNPKDPRQNIEGAAKYMAQMLKLTKGNIAHALAAYNAGPGNYQKYGGIPPFKETQTYVRNIMETYNRG
jgi:peptidoglycan hydrolase-like protein with peptidoglycan-binding domain